MTVTTPEPDPDPGLTVMEPPLPRSTPSLDVVQVTPTGAETLIAPDREPPGHPPIEPRLMDDGETASVTPLVKVAETDWLAFIVRLQAPVPEQAPPQFAKVEVEEATAVSCTAVPAGSEVLVGNVLTVPLPLVVTLSVYGVDVGDSTSVRLSGGILEVGG